MIYNEKLQMCPPHDEEIPPGSGGDEPIEEDPKEEDEPAN